MRYSAFRVVRLEFRTALLGSLINVSESILETLDASRLSRLRSPHYEIYFDEGGGADHRVPTVTGWTQTTRPMFSILLDLVSGYGTPQRGQNNLVRESILQAGQRISRFLEVLQRKEQRPELTIVFSLLDSKIHP